MALLAPSPDLPSGVLLPNRIAMAALSEAMRDSDALAHGAHHGRVPFASRRDLK